MQAELVAVAKLVMADSVENSRTATWTQPSGSFSSLRFLLRLKLPGDSTDFYAFPDLSYGNFEGLPAMLFGNVDQQSKRHA